MGCRNREFFSDNDNTSSSSLSKALLFATMYIIGLPVDVHIKDGSIYSGIFHTTSVDRDYGIVLKKARMTRKGKDNANVRNEGLIDTLVILSGDLVQVVARGVMLPADGVTGNWTNEDEEAVVRTVPCFDSMGSKVEKSPGSIMMDKRQDNQLRQVEEDKSERHIDDCRHKFEIVKEKTAEKIQGPGSSHETNTCITAEVENVEYGHKHMTLKPCINGLSCDDACASVKADDQCHENSILAKSASTTASQGMDLSPKSLNMPPKTLEMCATKSAKEFKLNPAAKVFSPSFVNPISATPAVPTVTNISCIPNSSPMATVAAIQPEVGLNFSCRPSMPFKVAQYGNLTAVNAGSGSQFSQPIVGQLAHRAQPLRYAANYTPVLAEPAYLQPSSPAVMVGRSGQLVYVHPVSHDLVHGATGISPVSTRPPLNLSHVQFPKQQGMTVGQAMPVCVPPSVLATGQQPFAVQGHIPILQPSFPVPRPIPVPGSNGYYPKLQ